MAKQSISTTVRVERVILRLRGQNVMLDADLAALYEVETKTFVRAVKRNRARVPADFMFQLGASESANLRYQFGTSSSWGGRRHRPYAFTEQGVAMLSGVLKGARAVAVNIQIMRAFVQLRRMLETHADLARRIQELEKKYDGQFHSVFDAIRVLMNPPPKPRRAIGFRRGV